MRKSSVKLIKQKKKVFLVIGILSFLCLIGAVMFMLFYDYYPVEDRVDKLKEYAQKDTEDYETIGWIRVQGTNIDFPVVYAPGFNFDGMNDNFAWNEIKTDKLLNRITISGHNFMNLSANPKMADEDSMRFESLMSFVYLDFVKENKYIQYTVNGENYIYKIYAVSFPEHGDTNVFVEKDFTSKEMKQYIEQSLKDSIFKFNIDVDENDKLISLITCTRMFIDEPNREIRIDARLVRDGEMKRNYSVEKTDKYKEIDEVMKGGEYNDEA